MPSKYWMVHRVGTNTSVMHLSREEAEKEAKKLSKTMIGQVFFVLEVVTGFVVELPQPVEVEIERSCDA